MNVLITGGGGFIGSHLVESQLAKGNRVRTIDLDLARLASANGNDNLEMIKGDITDKALMQQLLDNMDVVYHLASAHLDTTLANEIYHQVNVEATQQLLLLAHEANVKRFVHVSTNSVLGEIANPPADETTECHPTNIYEQTKLEGERVALCYCADTNFPIVIIRPAWVYGPRCPRTERLMRLVGKGRFVMFGKGDTLRHPVYITDAINALELSAKAEQAPGQIYFIAGERPVTIEELVNTIARVQKIKLKIVRLPLVVGKVAGSALQFVYQPLGKQPPISRRSIDFFIKDNAYDISKARRELGFCPQVELWAGLTETLAWQRNHDNMLQNEN